MKKLLNRISDAWKEAPYRHPYLPLGISIVALAISLAKCFIRIMQ